MLALLWLAASGENCGLAVSVPVPAQLRSHRLFSENFEHIAHLVDSATLYHTGENPCFKLPNPPPSWGRARLRFLSCGGLLHILVLIMPCH